jgi:hypothetical protein
VINSTEITLFFDNSCWKPVINKLRTPPLSEAVSWQLLETGQRFATLNRGHAPYNSADQIDNR